MPFTLGSTSFSYRTTTGSARSNSRSVKAFHRTLKTQANRTERGTGTCSRQLVSLEPCQGSRPPLTYVTGRAAPPGGQGSYRMRMDRKMEKEYGVHARHGHGELAINVTGTGTDRVTKERHDAPIVSARLLSRLAKTGRLRAVSHLTCLSGSSRV
ncbi:hypothetical protein CCMA1212_003785 [Trichoderma ghanense]|uniref:Uncharacterized protein n=1 Tax=Trichoderma ghanense TaxID=65468 RepID=A0ABY2H7F3_9HYPO